MFVDGFAGGFNAALNTKFGLYKFWQPKGQLVAVLRQEIYALKLWHTGVQFNRFVP